MPTTKAIRRQYSAAWLLPLTVTSGVVTGAGTQIEFDFVIDAGPEWPSPADASSQEFVSVLAANGITVEYPKVTTVVDGTTGDEKTGGASGGTAPKLKFTIGEWGKTLAGLVPPLLGEWVVCCIPIGENETSSEDGFYYLLGKLSGTISYDAKGEEVVTVALEVTGASISADTGGDTALTWDPGDIDEVGGNTVSAVALTSGELTALKSGAIVIK